MTERRVDVDILKELHAKGHDDSAIAKIMQVSRNAVNQNRIKLGLPLIRYIKTAEHRLHLKEAMHHRYGAKYSQIKELYQKGIGLVELEQRFGIHHRRIKEILKEDNLKIRPMGYHLVKDQGIVIPSNKETIAYIAGLLDGEGSINLRHGSVYICNTSKELIDFLHETLKGGCYLQKIPQNHNLVKACIPKPIYIWQISRIKDVLAFLKAVLPYLIVKREKAVQKITQLEQKLIFYEGDTFD